MKEITAIVENNLGGDYVIHASYKLNDIHYIIYKEYDGSRSVVLKDYNTLSPFFNNLIEADTWINTNS
jgi:glycine betaine/choline ABC-type transport system substrate-binding protein